LPEVFLKRGSVQTSDLPDVTCSNPVETGTIVEGLHGSQISPGMKQLRTPTLEQISTQNRKKMGNARLTRVTFVESAMLYDSVRAQ